MTYWRLLSFFLPLLLIEASCKNLIRMEEAKRLFLPALTSDARIVGGSAASRNQFPHQVALLRMGSLSCGGSLINSKWVLTAAHCVYNGNQIIPASSLTVVAGTVDLQRGGVLRKVRRVIPHEKYGDFRNDVALLELEQAYQLDESIQPIALGRSNVPAGSTITISGWGRLYSNGPLPSALQYNRVTALSASRCTQETGISSGLLCLQSPANNGACNGDSGGPAVYNNQLVGVANFVINYCGSNAPDGYAYVPSFVQWIEAKVN